MLLNPFACLISTDVNDLVRKIDVAITLGDGTLLSSSKPLLIKYPILGINMGVGFLTEVELVYILTWSISTEKITV